MAFASLISLAAGELMFASLDLCADEYLLMFAERSQLASVSFLAKDEDETALAGRANGLPANDGSIESLIKARPDVLLTSRPLSAGQQRLATRLSMRVVNIPYVTTPSGVAENVRMVARLTGKRAEAQQWLSRLDSVQKPAPSNRTMLWIGNSAPTLGDGGKAWLSLAGISVEDPRPALSRIEQVAASKAPLLISDYRADQYSRNSAWRDHPLVRGRMQEATHVDGRAFTCSGPMMLGAVEGLRR